MVSFKNLIRDIESIPISIEFLRKKIDVPVLKYIELKNTNRNALFKNTNCVVILLQTKKLHHYITLIARPDHIEYFSSLGNNFNSEVGENLFFENIVGGNFIYNRKALQSKTNYKIQDCALWVIARVALRDLKLREFVGLFQKKLVLQNYDEIVSLLSLLKIIR